MARPVSVTGDGTVSQGPVTVKGWSSDATADVVLREGGATGAIVAYINADEQVWWGPDGVRLANELYADHTLGNVTVFVD